METEDTFETGDGESSPRRWYRTPLVVASVATAVVLAGGGAAYWASSAGGGHGDQSGSPRPLALAGYPQGAAQGIASGEPAPGGTRYTASGALPKGPGTAPAYTADGGIDKAAAARLARALHVSGTPKDSGGVWQVGKPGGKDPSLQVSQQAPGGWSFTPYGTRGPCAVGPARTNGGQLTNGGQPAVNGGVASVPGTSGSPAAKGSSSAAKGSGASQACPMIPTHPSGDSGSAVSTARAERAVRPVLADLGLAHARLDARQVEGNTRVVTANPVIDGLPTYGWQTMLEVGANGRLAGGTGTWSKPTKGDSYPLVSADAALKQLNQIGAGSGGPHCGSPVAGGNGGAAGQPSATAGGSSAASASGGSTGSGRWRGSAPCRPVSATPSAGPRASVRGAELGLAARTVDGRPGLVPSWLFTVRPTDTKGTPDQTVDQTVSYPAVQPKYLTGPSSAPSRSAGSPSGSTPASSATSAAPGGKASRAPGGASAGRPGATPRLEVTSYSASGRTLTVHFWGGVCDDYAVSADQSGSKVTVRITGHPKHQGRPCSMIAKRMDGKATLHKPLAGRTVVNAATGKKLPASTS